MEPFTLTPFPILTTPRLVLRPITPADAPALFVLRSNPEVMRFIPRPLAQSVEEVRLFIEKLDELMTQGAILNWGVALAGNSELIGTMGFFSFKPEHFRADVGYMLRPDLQGRGLMKEALNAALDYGFRVLHLHSVEAVIAPENTASERLLLSSNFMKEAHFKENEYHEGRFVDTVHYSLLNPFTHSIGSL